MLKDIKGVIFDLDGTLVDSMWMWKQIDIEFLSMHGLEMEEGLQQMIGGKTFYETAVFFKERYSLSESLEEIMSCWNLMAENKYAKEVPLKDGVLDFLHKLKDNEIKMGIATSNSLHLTETCLKSNGIRDFFDVIISGRSDIQGKPAPDVYLMAAKNLSLQASECLVFEDLVDGIKAGKAAGMKVCCIHDRFSSEEEDRKKELADYYIYSFKEI
ncbi:MAG: HAD family phosphatase [Lachnospiraceae bacterium]|nr:HAD family phosphatase [Lachnospiraceae bacterium]